MSDPQLDGLDPVLVTGSSVLVDDDLAERFAAASKQWLSDAGYEATLTFEQATGFMSLAAVVAIGVLGFMSR